MSKKQQNFGSWRKTQKWGKPNSNKFETKKKCSMKSTAGRGKNIEEEEGELVRYCGPWTRPSVINFLSSLFANNNKKIIPVIKNIINH